MKKRDYKIHIMLLCGGSGKRLWPLSNINYPKQFLKYIKNDNEYISMCQRTYSLIKNLNLDISIITNLAYTQVLKQQLGVVDIIEEPESRNTFPAISLGIVNAFFEKKLSYSDYVIFLPIDAYTSDDFYNIITKLIEEMFERKSNLGIIGKKPNYPSIEYGYIKEKNGLVEEFLEKPDLNVALKLIENNYLFNTGIVAVKIGYMLDKLNNYITFNSYNEFLTKFFLLKKISFDYEILSNEKNILCLKTNSSWMDIGTYSNFFKVLDKNVYGNVKSINDKNTVIINELDLPIISFNNEDLMLISTSTGILIANRNKEFNLKEIDFEPNFNNLIYESYGYIKKLSSKTNMINIFKNNFIEYKTCTDKILNILSGSGVIIVNKKEIKAKEGVSIFLKKNDFVVIKSFTNIELIEIDLNKHEEN